MRLTYDPDANIAYLRFKERTGEVETVEIGSDVMVDLDENGSVCGIELLNANTQLAEGDAGKLVLVNALNGGRAELDVA